MKRIKALKQKIGKMDFEVVDLLRDRFAIADEIEKLKDSEEDGIIPSSKSRGAKGSGKIKKMYKKLMKNGEKILKS